MKNRNNVVKSTSAKSRWNAIAKRATCHEGIQALDDAQWDGTRKYTAVQSGSVSALADCVKALFPVKKYDALAVQSNRRASFEWIGSYRWHDVQFVLPPNAGGHRLANILRKCGIRAKFEYCQNESTVQFEAKPALVTKAVRFLSSLAVPTPENLRKLANI